MFFHAVALLLALITICGLVYGVLALLGARAFAHDLRRQRRAVAEDRVLRGVSLLKPLKGADEALRAALETHCRQVYDGPFEVLCGVRSEGDPAAAVVRELQAAYPGVVLRLVVCPEEMGTAGKVATLVQLLPEASYEYVLVNDADIHVAPEYLRTVMAAFGVAAKRAGDARRVGMVTAPYVGEAHPDEQGRIPMPSRLEALGIATEFMPGVLTARLLEGGLRFGLGSTLAMRVEALAAVGGFRPLLETLADDYELGARIAAAGYRVELAEEVVVTGVPAYRWRGFFDHQMRWARSTRDSRRLGYVGLGVTFCLPWAGMAWVASGFALWGLALVSVALLVRVAVALVVGVGVLRDGQVLRDLWLLPVRDGMGLAFWAWSYAGNTVVWRGERFRLRRGQMERVD